MSREPAQRAVVDVPPTRGDVAGYAEKLSPPFYDVDEANAAVIVRAVRRKPPHTTTEEIL